MYQIPEETFIEMKSMAEEYLNLKDIPNVLTRELSLGQKNRFNFACSILHKPKLLILDEPTIGLDILARSQIRRLLRAMNEKYKTTILLVTHDASDVEQLCEKILVIDKGNNIFFGSTAKFKKLKVHQRQALITFENEKSKIKLIAELQKFNRNNIKIIKLNQFSIRVIFPLEDNKLILDKINKIMNDDEVYEIKIEEISIESILEQMFDEF